jgi:PilZ domain-containing protein
MPASRTGPVEETSMLQRAATTRRYPRVPSEHPALVRLLGGHPFEEFAKTKMIGQGGCLLVSQESLGFSSLMELFISIKGRVLRTDARVAYEIQKGHDVHQVGVEFLRISPADREVIASLVAKKQAPAPLR